MVGNRTAASNTAGNISHNANNELLAYGDVEYVYDANGNMTQKKIGTAAVNYIYNTENRLIKVEDELTGLVIAEYFYDPFGRRLWKEVNDTRTYFFYTDEGLVAEYGASGTELKSYGYKPDSTWTTDPLFLKQDSQYFFYQNDHLGTPQKLTAQNGLVVWAATYTAFGEATVEIETVTNNLRFLGQYFDAETGLHYNWFRYYEPRVGRYLKIDPIGFAGNDVNWYGYAGNNPINVLDPNGLTHRYDIGTRLDYSCNCGWIDWSHANPGVANGPWFAQLWDGLHGMTSNTGWGKSRTGKGFKVTYAQTVNEDFNFGWFGLPLPPIRNVISTVTGGESAGLLVLVHEGTYFVKYDLSLPEQKSVALAIFQEVASHFEQAQSFYPYAWFTDSGYSEEDLPSDLIAFYMAIEGYSPDYIRARCGVVPPDKAREVWDQVYGRDGGIGQRKNTDIDFKPKDYNEYIPCTCPDKMKWPEKFDRIKAAPKGNLWRDWDYRID